MVSSPSAPSSHSADHWPPSSLKNSLLLGAVALGSGVILAPTVMPLMGIGDVNLALEAPFILHDEIGSGLAGGFYDVLKSVPLVGGKLAEGGLLNAAVTGVIGIGGVLVGDYVSKHTDHENTVDWGKLIRWTSLATSALVALPTVLASITNGITYIAMELLGANANPIIEATANITGTIPYQQYAFDNFSGAALAIPHFIGCGASFIPAAITLGLNASLKKESAIVSATPSFTNRLESSTSIPSAAPLR